MDEAIERLIVEYTAIMTAAAADFERRMAEAMAAQRLENQSARTAAAAIQEQLAAIETTARAWPSQLRAAVNSGADAHAKAFAAQVGDGIRQKLDGLGASARQAGIAVEAAAHALRFKVMGLFALAGAVVAVLMLMAAAIYLPTPEQMRALRTQADDLQAKIDHLQRQGAALHVRRCNDQIDTLCVEVDRYAKPFRSGEQYFILAKTQ